MSNKRKIKEVLVVDDDQIVTALLEKYLQGKGYDVTAVTEAAEGLEIAMAQKPDLIILDVMMPVINGYNFCRLLKAEKDRADIPIILLTARGQLKDIEIGLAMGADAYLIKPVNIDELCKIINVLESAEN